MKMGTPVITTVPAPPYPGGPINYPASPAPYPVTTQPPVIVVNQQQSHAPAMPQVLMVQHLPTEFPGRMMCPRCQVSVLTKTRYIVGSKAWCICGIVGVLLLWPCCLIPFCVDSCKDVEHSCSVCGNVLHVHKRAL